MFSKQSEHGTIAPDGRPKSEQPKWRRDFPIDWPEDEYVSRRELVKFMVLTSLAFVVGQFWLVGQKLFGSGTPTGEVAIADVSEIPVGGSKVFQYPAGDEAPRILVRTAQDSWVAYDQQCTHLLCPVIPAVDEGRLLCPCHNGHFDLATGQPLAGPPRRPLSRVHIEIRNGTVYATGMEERT